MPCLLDMKSQFRIIWARNSQTGSSTSPPSTPLKTGNVVTVILNRCF